MNIVQDSGQSPKASTAAFKKAGKEARRLSPRTKFRARKCRKGGQLPERRWTTSLGEVEHPGKEHMSGFPFHFDNSESVLYLPLRSRT